MIIRADVVRQSTRWYCESRASRNALRGIRWIASATRSTEATFANILDSVQVRFTLIYVNVSTESARREQHRALLTECNRDMSGANCSRVRSVVFCGIVGNGAAALLCSSACVRACVLCVRAGSDARNCGATRCGHGEESPRARALGRIPESARSVGGENID